MISLSIQGFPWRRLGMLARPFLSSPYRNKGLMLAGGAAVCIIAKLIITVYINDTNGSVMTALKDRQAADFWSYLAFNVGLIVLLMPFEVLKNVCTTVLGITIRLFLSSGLFAGYFAGMAALKLERENETRSDDERIDNPEWRMTAEPDSGGNTFVGVFFSFFESSFGIITFSHQLWLMSPKLTFADIGYALFGSVVVFYLGQKLSPLNARQQKLEGDLRAGLTEARNQAPIIAGYRAQEVVHGLALKRQDAVIANLMDLMRVNRNMQVFTALYSPLAPLLPIAIMGAIYLHDPSLDFGSIARAQGNFSSLFNGLSVFVANIGGIQFLSAVINRLGTLMEFLQAAGVEPLPDGSFIRIEKGAEISCKELSVNSRDGKILVDKLDLKLKPGESILIRGPQATAKSSLLNAMIGIWPYGSGTVERPERSDVMILGTQPFMQPMSLRTALSYPESDKTDASDDRLKEVLRLVDLGYLVDKDKLDLDTPQDWTKLLSLSKQQRLAMARIINKKPKYCLIDEAANRLEAENEKLLMTLLKTLGVTYFLAGNGESLVKYATWILEIADDGSWKIQNAAEYEPTFWRKLEFLMPAFLLPEGERGKVEE